MHKKYGFFGFILASLACCMLIAAFITGCGGSNNPSGPSNGTAISNSATTASGTVKLNGLLIDSSTNNLVDDNLALLRVTIILVGTNATYVQNALNNSAFTFNDLQAGNYLIRIEDISNPKRFETTQIIKELSGEKVDISLRMVPVPSLVVPSNLNFFGKVVEATIANPVSFATIMIKNSSGSSYETSTLATGTFSILGLSSGTYELSFSKSGFETASRTLSIRADGRIILDSKDITAADINTFTDGAGVSRTGYDLGEIILAPNWAETGGIAGLLYNTNVLPKVPYINTPFHLVYDSNTQDAVPPASIIKNFYTNDLGYFFAKNLPKGFYLVARPGYTLSPIISGGNITGYNFAPGDLVFDVWLEVNPGAVTIIP
jgi:hypothetical protein